MSNYCINASDTNKTLEATFRFIYENQKAPDGSYYSTNIYLGISSISNLNYENYNDRNLAVNIIVGKIIEVRKTYCKVETISLCENEVQIYTISYSDIENIISTPLLVYSDEYINYMNRLPRLCGCCESRDYNLLNELETELLNLKQSQTLNLIYAGIFSSQYTKEEYVIIRNLIYINKNGIVPINVVSGFFIVDSKTNKEAK